MQRIAVSDALRQAIKRDGRTMSAIAAAAELPHTVVTRFVRHERSLSAESIDRLAEVVGLTVTRRQAA